MYIFLTYPTTSRSVLPVLKQINPPLFTTNYSITFHTFIQPLEECFQEPFKVLNLAYKSDLSEVHNNILTMMGIISLPVKQPVYIKYILHYISLYFINIQPAKIR